jgi:hypothetical protein
MTDPYTVPAGTFGAFTYTPIIARLFSVFSLSPGRRSCGCGRR